MTQQRTAPSRNQARLTLADNSCMVPSIDSSEQGRVDAEVTFVLCDVVVWIGVDRLPARSTRLQWQWSVPNHRSLPSSLKLRRRNIAAVPAQGFLLKGSFWT